jgi:hypothetical protein
LLLTANQKQSITKLTHEETVGDLEWLKDNLHTLPEKVTQLKMDICLSQNGWWSAHTLASLVECLT